jgi:hypothetical protein
MNFDRSTLIVFGVFLSAVLARIIMPTTLNKALAAIGLPQ